MVAPRDKKLLLLALAASLVCGVVIGAATQGPAEANASSNVTHNMTPSEHCQHMPEMCPTPGGNASAFR